VLTINDNDLRVFSDIGTNFDSSAGVGDHRVFQFIMDGRKIIVTAGAVEDPIQLTVAEHTVVFANAKTLLASEQFGDLRR